MPIHLGIIMLEATLLIIVFQIYLGVMTTGLIRSLRLGKLIMWTLYFIVWGLAAAYIYSSLIQNTYFIDKWNKAEGTPHLRILSAVQLTSHQVIAYIAVLILLYHFKLLNDKTLVLVKKI